MTGRVLLGLLLMLAASTTPAAAATTTTAVAGPGQRGVCWGLKRRDGSCGRALGEGVTRQACCAGRHRRGWTAASTLAAATSYTTSTSASLGRLNATSVVTLGDHTCAPCTSSCAGVVCGEDRKCVVRCGWPRCVCSPQCHLKHKEAMCGSDGRTYKSECHLLKRACRKTQRLTVAHYGPCQTCVGVRCKGSKKCVLDEQLQPRCVRCPASCPSPGAPRPLCAADGRTYASPCHLKKASCRAGRLIPRAYKGRCRPAARCEAVRCWRGDRCLTGEGQQPQCTACGRLHTCRPSSRPVCGSDGRVYPSWCAFRHEACRSGRALAPALHHHCAANHTQPDDCNKHTSQEWRQQAKQREEAALRQHQKELRQQLETQRVLQGVVEAAGGASRHPRPGPNSVEADPAAPPTFNDSRKRRRRRRRNCKKNSRKRTRKEEGPWEEEEEEEEPSPASDEEEMTEY